MAIASLVVLAGLATVVPAQASEGSASTGGITATDPVAVGTVSTDYAEAMVKLEALRGTQTTAEIAAIVTSGQQVETLVDDNNVTVAAYIVEQPAWSIFAISPRGPGCAAGDACAWVNGTIANGWYGTGQRDINVSNVLRIFAGSNNTTFWRSGAGDNLAPNVTSNFTSGRSYYSITRS